MRNWDELAAPWLRQEAVMEAAHRPVLDAMLAKAALKPGQSVLDIGIGSGLSTRLAHIAVGKQGTVCGIDVAPPFVHRARERLDPSIHVVEADAETHPFEPQRFDSAISIFGTMFFADTVAAFANIRSALRPMGRFVFAGWAPPQDNPWLTMTARIVTEVLGPPTEQPDPTGPGPFRFADPELPLTALRKAGWQARHETLDLLLTPLGSPEALAEVQLDLGPGAIRIRDEGAGDAQIKAIKDGVIAGFTGMLDGSGAVRVPARVHLFEATIPA